MKKILIIGKKSFIGSNLKKFLSNKFKIDHISYEKIDKKNVTFFNKYSHIINTSIHPNYINKKYNSQYDLDIKFVRKFKKPEFFYIFLNTRKIYSLKENISENSKIKPKNNYAKNKLITEKNLKIYLKKKLISLRISNIIGKRIEICIHHMWKRHCVIMH